MRSRAEFLLKWAPTKRMPMTGSLLVGVGVGRDVMGIRIRGGLPLFRALPNNEKEQERRRTWQRISETDGRKKAPSFSTAQS